ncbi:MAG TPA: hypothetical protein ENK66_04010 [Arcobacter sp.]|nr:hypothetical protein [Arcobacter sp.]
MDLEGGKFRDIILENRAISKGLHIIVDKDTFEIKEFAYNDESDEFLALVNKYDLKKREYYCQIPNKKTNKCFDAKNQIHSNSPYAIFFKLKPTTGVFKANTIEKRFKDFQEEWFDVTNYFHKLIENFSEESKVKDRFVNHLELYKSLLKKEYYIKNEMIEELEKMKAGEYLEVYTNDDLSIVEEYYEHYITNMVFARKDFKKDVKYIDKKGKEKNKQEDSYFTSEKHICPIYEDNLNLGISGFLASYEDSKKPLLKHLTRNKIYGGYSSLYSGKVVQNLSLFEELLKLKLLPNPLPIFISNKDAVDNENNKVYFDLLKQDNEQLKYKEVIKKSYEKISDNNDEINELNFYLIFWSLQDGITFRDVDYIDAFQYKLKDFEIKNIFELKGFYSGEVENIFNMEWGYFSKFFYTLQGDIEKNNLLQQNYFTEKINLSKGETVPAMVATKFYQYNKAIFDYIYKGKLEVISGYIFDDICISIIREQIKENKDWGNTYKIKEKLALYLSLHKNFHKGEDLATQVIELRETVSELIENEDKHLMSDEAFAFASGQLIWYILKMNKSETKTHSLLDIFISKNRVEDYTLAIAQNIQKYSHAFKFFNSKNWFDKLASEVLGYKLEQQTIKSLIPLIMSGYFSKNMIEEKIAQKAEENKKNGDTDGE